MKKWIRLILMVLVISAAIPLTVTGEVAAMTEKPYGYGDYFGEYDYVFYKMPMEYTGYVTIFAVYGFSDITDYTSFCSSCSGEFTDDGQKTWKTRYSYTLCDESGQEIDPIGWHKPGKTYYRYSYYLPKKTFYLKIKTNRKASTIYLINGVMNYQSGNKSIASNKPGGKTKSKATKLRCPEKLSVYKQAKNYSALERLEWNGNYYAFPMLSSGKNAQTWFKYYSDGKNPLYIITRLDILSGKWDLVIYGPSCPGGRTFSLPNKMVIGKLGEHKIYKNGKLVKNGNVITLARSNGKKTIGPCKHHRGKLPCRHLRSHRGTHRPM